MSLKHSGRREIRHFKDGWIQLKSLSFMRFLEILSGWSQAR